MSTSMHRLQISLPDRQMDFLKERSHKIRRSVAGIIRELIAREADSVEKPITDDPIWEIVGIGNSGKSAKSVDETAYQEDWYARPPRQSPRTAARPRIVKRRTAKS